MYIRGPSTKRGKDQSPSTSSEARPQYLGLVVTQVSKNGHK